MVIIIYFFWIHLQYVYNDALNRMMIVQLYTRLGDVDIASVIENL